MWLLRQSYSVSLLIAHLDIWVTWIPNPHKTLYSQNPQSPPATYHIGIYHCVYYPNTNNTLLCLSFAAGGFLWRFIYTILPNALLNSDRSATWFFFFAFGMRKRNIGYEFSCSRLFQFPITVSLITHLATRKRKHGSHECIFTFVNVLYEEQKSKHDSWTQIPFILPDNYLLEY